VFTESLPSNGYTRHIRNILYNLLRICAQAWYIHDKKQCASRSNKYPKNLSCRIQIPREAFGEHSLAGQRFLNGSYVSRPVECQLKIMTIQGDQASAKRQEKLKIFERTQPRRPSPNNPWARRHRWDQLWSLPGDLNRKSEHTPHCSFITTTRPPTRPWKPQSLLLTTTWLRFPIFPTRQTCPLWFRFVSQIEKEIEGTTFWNSVWHPKWIASGTRQHYGKLLPLCFSSMEKRWYRCIGF
jgi:hypothetical protein